MLKELVRSSSITIMDGLQHHINGHHSDSSTMLTSTNDGHQITNCVAVGLNDYDNRCIDSEPTSLIDQQLRNNNHSHLHHHQLTLM